MDRVNAVICHPLYLEYYHRLERAEKERIFCRHQMSHLLDVARIAYIRNLEKGYGFRKDVIYAAAVLHDIGKALQYEEKVPHEIAGERIAGEILDTLPKETGFSEEEKRTIKNAVRGHRRLRDGRTHWKSFCMKRTKRRGCVFHVRQTGNVTGVKRRKIWR